MKLIGKCSKFGGPLDEGVSPSEGLAFIYEIDQKPQLFLPKQPEGTTGLARRLNPLRFYIATRWDYDVTSKEDLLNMRVLVRAPKTGKQFTAMPADWGPHEDTGRVADISGGLMAALGISTDDEVEVIYGEDWELDKPEKPTGTKKGIVAISAGHGLLIRGAEGPKPWGLDEVDEARRVVPRVAELLRELDIEAIEIYDDTSTTQDENLAWLVGQHNDLVRDLDVSVHFNAYEPTDETQGCEVFAISQMELAANVSARIAARGDLEDRGAKDGSGLYFLKYTDGPAILVETCFVDAQGDISSYEENFDDICAGIASEIAAGI